MTEAITFVASLPPIQSAITLDGMGDGARIKLDIPRSDVGAALLLQHHGAGRALKVTIEIIDLGIEDGKRNGHKETYY
jgi:hypothetical protein